MNITNLTSPSSSFNGNVSFNEPKKPCVNNRSIVGSLNSTKNLLPTEKQINSIKMDHSNFSAKADSIYKTGCFKSGDLDSMKKFLADISLKNVALSAADESSEQLLERCQKSYEFYTEFSTHAQAAWQSYTESDNSISLQVMYRLYSLITGDDFDGSLTSFNDEYLVTRIFAFFTSNSVDFTLKSVNFSDIIDSLIQKLDFDNDVFDSGMIVPQDIVSFKSLPNEEKLAVLKDLKQIKVTEKLTDQEKIDEYKAAFFSNFGKDLSDLDQKSALTVFSMLFEGANYNKQTSNVDNNIKQLLKTSTLSMYDLYQEMAQLFQQRLGSEPSDTVSFTKLSFEEQLVLLERLQVGSQKIHSNALQVQNQTLKENKLLLNQLFEKSLQNFEEDVVFSSIDSKVYNSMSEA